MKKIQKHRLTVKGGKITDEKQIDERTVADSVADDLVSKGDHFQKEGFKELSPKKIETVDIWKEAKSKKAETKKEDKK